jgi:Ca2+-binding RTX toxin-like protein
MRRIPLLAAVAAAAVLVPAAVSQAATVSYTGGALVYSGAGSEANDVLVTTYQPYGEDTTYLAFSDATGVPQSTSTNLCHADTSGYGAMLCALDPNRPVKLYGNAGKDRLGIYFSEVPASIPFELHGGDGNDELKDSSGQANNSKLYGDAGNDTLLGYAGNDYLDGGDGQDEVDGGEGNDSVHGGTGNDVMWGDHYADPGSDVIDGGPGLDTTQDWSTPEDLDQQPAIDVTLDGKANDGRPGESDNVVAVEKFQMYVVGRLVGSSASEELNIHNPGNSGPSTLIGNDGNDTLYGHDFDDTVDGGAGNDHVEGGYGNDTVTGGPGQDVIYGDATASRCTWYSCKVPPTPPTWTRRTPSPTARRSSRAVRAAAVAATARSRSRSRRPSCARCHPRA